MNHYKGQCNKCGKCCKALAVGAEVGEMILHEQQRERKVYEERLKQEGYNDKILAVLHWKRIPKEEAMRILERTEDDITRRSYWFSCGLHKDNQCSIHSERPLVCKGYPNYQNKQSPLPLLNTKDCGYTLIEYKTKES